MIVSDITTSHWEISFWLAWLMSSACTEELFFIFKAITNRDIPSNKVEIPIHTHARFLASPLLDVAITIAKINNNAHSDTIHHHRGCCSLLFTQNIIRVIHLIRAHRANIHIIIVHTNWEYEKINPNHNKANKSHPIQSNRVHSPFLFLNALMMADIPDVNRKNHNIISINFQNILGAHIVIIQKIITTMDNPIINEYGQVCILFHSINSFIHKK